MDEDEPVELLVGEDKEITESDQEASVIKFVNQVIWEAFKDRATDIHFEPAEDELRIRYRIDGILHQTPMPPQLKRYQAALISRIKVMSGMNISEKRLPQDGRINVRIKGDSARKGSAAAGTAILPNSKARVVTLRPYIARRESLS